MLPFWQLQVLQDATWSGTKLEWGDRQYLILSKAWQHKKNPGIFFFFKQICSGLSSGYIRGFFYSVAKIFLEQGTKILNLDLLYNQTTAWV